MEPVISVFFDNDRSYIALLEPDGKGLSLAYIDSTAHPIEFTGGQFNKESAGIAELQNSLWEIAGAAQEVVVTLSMESVFVKQIPAPPNLGTDDIRELIHFEIAQHYPQHDSGSFSSVAFPMSPKRDGSQMMLAILMENMTQSILSDILAPLGAPISRTSVAQIAAQNAYSYCYPERKNSIDILFGFQGKYLDVSVIKKGELAYFNVVPVNPGFSLTEICQLEIDRALDEFVAYIDKAFFFGFGILKADLDAVQLTIPAQRLNAFRMTSTTLGERERAYCSRVAHILPPCLGAAMPQTFDGLIIS